MVLNSEFRATQDDFVFGAREIEAQLAIAQLHADHVVPIERLLVRSHGRRLRLAPRIDQLRDTVGIRFGIRLGIRLGIRFGIRFGIRLAIRFGSWGFQTPVTVT
jgi:hypothetical protein